MSSHDDADDVRPPALNLRRARTRTAPANLERYRLRREAGAASRQETRRRLLAAADTLFREQGYRTTTVAAIAERAEVSLQTLYLAWGSKRDLLLAVSNATALNSDLPVALEEWRRRLRDELADDVDDPTTRAYLASITRLFCRYAQRGTTYRQLYRQVGATDPEIDADRAGKVAGQRATMAAVADGIPRSGLRSGLSGRAVADTLWSLTNPEMYDLLTIHGDHTPATFQAWLEATLVAVLCPDAAGVGHELASPAAVVDLTE